MTEQPRKPTATVAQPDDHISITWTNTTPEPAYRSVTYQRRGQCEQCPERSLWASPNEPLLCATHRDLAAYAALPWWRRAITRKPKP